MSFWFSIISLVIVVASTYLGYFLNKDNNPPKIFGVYSRPGKWFYFKYYTILTLLHIRQFLYGLRKKDTKLGQTVRGIHDQLDMKKPLSNHMKACDAVFFQGVDNNNGYYLCGGVERRQGNKVNGVFYIVVPKLGLLRSEHLPKTSLDATSLKDDTTYGGGDIQMTMIEPFKKWNISYNGYMWLDSKCNLKEVELKAEWTSNYPHFLFYTDLDKGLIAEAIAREPWDAKLFTNLINAHQTHYEQMGNLKGELKVNGETHNIEMASFRNHSWGFKRDWSLMHRYAFHMFYLDDNTRICVGVISQPCTTSHLALGYIVTPKRKIHRITKCDFNLFHHGEGGRPPKDLAFCITANFKRYDCSVTTIYECEHFKGNDVEARFIERFTTCCVNGIRGRGIAEWQYNNLHSQSI